MHPERATWIMTCESNPMSARISAFLYRISSVWSALAITLVYGWFMVNVMQPESERSAAYAGDWGAPDRNIFYTPDELYDNLADWPPEGREAYIEFRLSLDILWALAYTGFLVTIMSCALRYATQATDRRRLLNVVPLITLASDYLENALGIAAVVNAAARPAALAWLLTGATSVKWISLVVAHLLLVYALGLAALTAIRNRRERRESEL